MRWFPQNDIKPTAKPVVLSWCPPQEVSLFVGLLGVASPDLIERRPTDDITAAHSNGGRASVYSL